MILSIKNKPDSIGAISSALCLIHCLATPFLFAAHTQTINHDLNKPIWWSSLDLVLLLVSALAIYKTTITTTKKWVEIGLWSSFILLTFIIINEKMSWLGIPEVAIYIPSISLILFHVYNSKYCKCKRESCCVNGRL
ncbi:MerC domain-containing protein [uncultured Algibacter sp.]|uniref:MerC domain-containing protein n=1 Tax=uncultured Algibacter sp. TaxID=298659 RepID=UPI002606FF3E|nr:MerC domain-containing protein [uncultured Algibacter sp.]